MSYICTTNLNKTTNASRVKSGWASINIIKFIFAMTIGKIKPSATLVAQFPAGVEVEAIQHEGRVFLPVMGMGDFAAQEPAARTQEPAPAAPAAPAKKEEKPAAGGKKYTEDELMDMETKDLLKLCKSMGIDPDATEGKNTNKKLRLLVLEAQEKGGGEDDPDEQPAGEGDDDELVAQVTEVLEDFDGGNCNKKKAISRICALVEDADKGDVTDLVEEFEGDGDAEIEEYAGKIAAALRGEEAPAKKEAPKSKKKGGKKEDENLVSVDDLEVGDRVSVYWDDDNQDWLEGEVKSIKKGKVLIAYDDDTEDYIDPEVHTKIKKLDD